MKIIPIVIFVLYTIIVSDAAPSCESHIFHYTFEHLTCIENGIELHGLAEQIATNQMTYVELEQNIASLCQTANIAKCYQAISQPITGPCNEADKLQHFRNSIQVVLTFNEYLCQYNGTKYLEFVKNDGAACYFNEEKANCYTFAKLNANIEQFNHFKDDSICGALDADSTCLHHYDSCENRNVKLFFAQILRSLKEKFSC